jgi:starch synthase
MKVLFVSNEVAPFAKVGGLADVAGSLPRAIAEQGVDIRVVMP